MRTIEVDYDSCVTYRGRHRDIHYEVVCHSFRDTPEMYCFDEMWCTYILLSEEMHDKFKGRINSLPWNGGQTYYRKITEDHVDVPADLRAKWGKPFYKIGDDFTHLWDMEESRYKYYTRERMERHIKEVIDELLGGTPNAQQIYDKGE